MRKAAMILSAAALGIAAAPHFAQAAFQNGQLAVIRLGNGISNTTDPNYIPFDTAFKTQPVSIQIYDVTGASPALVSSTPLPSNFASQPADPNRFVLSARIDENDAKLTVSSNQQYLMLGGYQENLNVGSSEINYVVTSNAPRVIGRLDGNLSFTTSVLNDGSYAGVSLNAVASDNGQRFWTAGGNTNPGDVGGLRYVPSVGAGSVNVTTGLFGAQTDSYRGLRMVQGHLYANTPAQNSFNQTAPNGAKYRRGVYDMNVNGALPASATPIAASATSIMSSNDGFSTDANGNFDATTPPASNAKGEFYPKTDSVFLDLDNNGALDTAYGTGGKGEVQKWHFESASSVWKRDMAVDLIKIASLGDPLVVGDTEVNALDAFVQGNIVNVFMSTDLGVLRLQDQGWMGGIVNPDQIDGTATSTGSNRMFFDDTPGIVGGKFLGYTADDNYQFRGLVMVPEPASFALLGFGTLAMTRRRKAR